MNTTCNGAIGAVTELNRLLVSFCFSRCLQGEGLCVRGREFFTSKNSEFENLFVSLYCFHGHAGGFFQERRVWL